MKDENENTTIPVAESCPGVIRRRKVAKKSDSVRVHAACQEKMRNEEWYAQEKKNIEN